MKRSEVVKKILDHFWALGCDPIKASDSANEILDELENVVGMLPPTVMLSSTGDFMPTRELLDEANIDYEPAWEE